MRRRAPLAVPDVKPITLGHYTLMKDGLEVRGRPSFEEHEDVGRFIRYAHKRTGFWLADWLRYGESREDWRKKLEQAEELTGLTPKTLRNVRAVAKIPKHIRHVDTVDFSLHAEVAGLELEEQVHWLDRAEMEGWTERELRLEIAASRRRKVIAGQAVLRGMYRVIYADYPWPYGDRPPSGSGAQQHYPGMPIDEGCKLPVAAHAMTNAVLFFWVTAPYLYHATDNLTPDAFRLVRAWGFTPKTGMVWDKVLSAGGHYVAVKHEHLIIATRGSCLPDRPVPMPDSVQTVRRDGEHSEKPPEFRKLIEQLYDGPYLELFGREKVSGWDVFGNDARLWTEQVAS